MDGGTRININASSGRGIDIYSEVDDGKLSGIVVCGLTSLRIYSISREGTNELVIKSLVLSNVARYTSISFWPPGSWLISRGRDE